MKERFKERLLRDMRDYWRIAVAIAGILLAMDILVGQTCTMRILIGLPCPWCGMTRALLLLVTGRFADSWQMHPMAVFYVLLGALFLVYRYSGRFRIMFYMSLAAVAAATLILYLVRFPTLFPDSPPFDYDPNNLFARLFLGR